MLSRLRQIVGLSVRAGRLLRYALVGSMALAGVLLFILASASGNSGAFERNYPILLAANGAIALILFVLVTALAVRLVRRVRAGRFGAKLMARFALAFALMGVVPGVLVYMVSSQFLMRSIESWFNVQVESALESGLAVGRGMLENQRDELKTKARAMAFELADVPRDRQTALLDRLRERAAVAQASIVDVSGRPVWTVSEPGQPVLPSLPSPSQLRGVLTGGPLAVIEGDELSEEKGKGLQTRAIVTIPLGTAPDVSLSGLTSLAAAGGRVLGLGHLRMPGADAPFRMEEPRFLQLVQPVPPALAANAHLLQVGYAEYQRLSLSRSGMQIIYRLTLTLTLLLAVFAAIASGVLLASSMTAPLVELAAGTKSVAEGDYRPVREFKGSDELSLLPQFFNAMTRQLGDARNAIETRSRQLEAARAYLERVLANLSAGVIVLDERFSIVTANFGAGRILGLPLANFSGEPLIDHAPALAQHLSRGFLDQALAATPKDSWQQQIQLQRGGAAQEPLALLVRGSRLPLEDGRGYVVVFDDITQVISAQRAVAWGEVARRLAHEIKNPLMPIQLTAERLNMKLASALPTEAAAILERGTTTIVNQVTAMKRMVDEFRDYARLPAGRPEALDINDLLSEIGGLYGADGEPAAGQNNEVRTDQVPASFSLRLHLAPSLPMVMADPGQMRQVLHNLIGNAMESIAAWQAEAMARGQDVPDGWVKVSTELAVESAPTTDQEGGEPLAAVRLRVEDNGPGFPANILRHAFEPYVTTKPKGTGLGLALVKKIVEEHGGRIQLVNREGGNGAVVTILLHRLVTA